VEQYFSGIKGRKWTANVLNRMLRIIFGMKRDKMIRGWRNLHNE
jgi:hypothetical protein